LSHPQAVEDWLALSLLPGLGCTLISRLVQWFGSPAAVLNNPSDLRSRPGIGPQLAAVLGDGRRVAAARRRARDELGRLDRLNVTLLTLDSSAFPSALRDIPDCPVLLFCRGGLDWLTRPAVAVIGSRAATDYGRRVATSLAADLTAAGLVVVSGAAYGIDAAAHRGALAGGGGTVAVLGCGVDVVYPRTHADLFAAIAAKGLVLSEYPLETRPEAFRFPARNRIISGLAQAVVVVEATEKSGSLITARLALDQGREVFAVPGRVDSPKSAGAHRLIQQGAHLVANAADVLEALAWGGERAFSGSAVRSMPALTEPEQKLLAIMEAYPLDIDGLAQASGQPVSELHGLLLQLELKGMIRQVPGQQYERVHSD
jgi:DNA processing protein